jgi:hypothetical protein
MLDAFASCRTQMASGQEKNYGEVSHHLFFNLRSLPPLLFLEGQGRFQTIKAGDLIPCPLSSDNDLRADCDQDT